MPTLEDQLMKYLEDAHALEQASRHSMIATTQDEEMLGHLRHHNDET